MKPGLLLGELWRVGRPLPVTAPEGVSGAAAEVLPSGSWVAFETVIVRIGSGVVSAEAEAVREEDPDLVGTVVVRAETDGTIWLSPDPASPAFAPVGAKVAARATLALVEVMKTFSPIRAEGAGEVVRVSVRSGDAVVAGQEILRIRGG